MLHGLGRGQQTGTEFRGDVLALFDDAVDGRAFFALRFLFQKLEDLFEPRDLFLGFGLMFFEGGFQIRVLRGFCHLGQGREDLLLRIENVLERIMK
jgi:hypothetical protein